MCMAIQCHEGADDARWVSSGQGHNGLGDRLGAEIARSGSMFPTGLRSPGGLQCVVNQGFTLGPWGIGWGTAAQAGDTPFLQAVTPPTVVSRTIAPIQRFARI